MITTTYRSYTINKNRETGEVEIRFHGELVDTVANYIVAMDTIDEWVEGSVL